jgi:hypothetical protein
MEFTLPPGSVAPPPHVHPAERKGPARVPVYLSMLMREYPDTILPGRARERIGIGALAGLGRLFRLRTSV